MTLEEQLAGWTGPSSDTEQEEQERAERMVREAVRERASLKDCDLTVFAKGSYKNNTNVRSDSDVDIAVQCHEAMYWNEASPGVHPASTSYGGIWTPSKLRTELVAALRAKFPAQVDASGSTAIRINSNSSRVDADVVPCFDYRYYFSSTSWRDGSKVFKKDGTGLVNWPDQQYANGVAKNTRTGRSYKGAVRIMKRIENAMVEADYHREIQSFFVECLAYNVSDEILKRSTWVETIKGVIYTIWNETEGSEPSVVGDRWLEVSECKYLFHSEQPWSRKDAHDFAYAAWNYMGFNK